MDYERDEDVEKSTTLEVLSLTMKIYGSAYLIAIVTYIIVRPRYPLIYNFCNSVKKYQNKLAENHFGHFKWIYKNFQHSDDDMLENCGLTAVVLLRFLRMGMKIAAVGIFNSIYLIPVNVYGCEDENDECSKILDAIEKIGLGNLSSGSLSLIATTVAAYIMFCSTMYFIYHEFQWFTTARHHFLSKPRPDNYSVYVAHIPKKFRGDVALVQYFREIFDTDDVLEANIALDLYNLERKVATRKRIVQKLEHAYLKRGIDKKEPSHLSKSGDLVFSIPVYTKKLESLNDEISNVITTIETAKSEEKRRFLNSMGESTFTLSSSASGSGLENSTSSILQPYDESEELDGLLEANQFNQNTENENKDCLVEKLSIITESDDSQGEKPMEEFFTPKSNDDENHRYISELPIDVDLPCNGGSHGQQQNLDNGSEDHRAIAAEPTSVLGKAESSFTFANHEPSESDSNTAATMDASHYISLPDNVSDSSGQFRSLSDLKEGSSNDDASSVYVPRTASKSSLMTSDNTDDEPTSSYHPAESDTEPLVEDMHENFSSTNIQSALGGVENESKSSLNHTSSDESASFYVLDGDADSSFLSDLRRALTKDASCRSLLSDNSDSQNDVQIVLDTSLLKDTTPRIGHQRSVTFGTIKSSVSTASKRTKDSLNKSMKITSKGMKKSVHVIQDGMKKSANALHHNVKKSADVMHHRVKKSANFVQGGVKKTIYVVNDGMKKTVFVVQDGAKKSALVFQDSIKKSVSNMKHVGAKSIKLATNLIRGSEDGRVRDGGFVTFTTLTAKAQCVQMLHHSKPFTFYVTDAPQPKDIFWNNVGLTHKKQQIGFAIAQALTAVLCLFWTIPVTFVSSFSELDALKKTIPTLENAIANHPWLEPLLTQLNPMLIVILKMILPKILSKFCEREGHISRITLNASLLTKLAIFLVVQIFFVPAISGSIFAQLPEIIDDWRKLMELLATSVPGQVKSFIQFLFVNVFISSGLELLRVIKVGKAFIRAKVGPNLSEKERNMVYMGLEPLCVPEEMQFPLAFAEIVLYCMILLVYSCIAPVMSYVMFIIFLILLVTYQNQFIFTYSVHFDEGGALWSRLMKITLFALIIAQVTLIGIMSIKQSSLSSSLLVPLCWFTIFFGVYLEQQHYKVTNHLPSTICRKIDAQNYGKLDKSFLKEKYLQPALKVKTVVPDTCQDEENNILNATILEKTKGLKK